jgi:hypothetical protein
MMSKLITDVANSAQNGLGKETADVVTKGRVIKENDWQNIV